MTTKLMDRAGMSLTSMSTPGTGMMGAGGTMPAGMNMMMVPHCTMKMEKCTGGMKIACTCDDAMLASMLQNLCMMTAGGMCSCCMTMNGMAVCACNLMMGLCKCEMTEKGCTLTCTSGDRDCCAMIQAYCECMGAMMKAGCMCCMMMGGTPVCYSC
jgi:hypothetical protein